MKHFIKLFFIFNLALFSISCSKDETEHQKYEPTADELIIGTWWNNKLYFAESNAYQEFNNFEVVIDFLDNGTGFWRIKEDDGEISIDNFTYKFYGKYLLLEYEDYFDDGYVKVTEQFIIDKINIKEMQLSYKHDDLGNITFFFKNVTTR